MEKLKSGILTLGIALTPEQLGAFETYYRQLIAWNQRINLTAITDYEEVQVKHFLDSLTVAAAVNFEDAGKNLSIIDVGTGAGFPGIPLKIVFPGIRLTLLEATAKKIKFLEDLVDVLALENVEIVTGRAEEIAHQPQYREAFDIVLSRAVASLPSLVELTLPFCKIGGRFIAQKKGDLENEELTYLLTHMDLEVELALPVCKVTDKSGAQKKQFVPAEVAAAQKAIATMGGCLGGFWSAALKELQDSRYLVVIDKVKSTPAKYPRRPGMPEKRPLL